VMKVAVSAPTGELDRLTTMPRAQRHVWLVDSDERLEGCVDTRGGTGDRCLPVIMPRSEIEQLAVLETASLRDALSHMLSQGLRTIPVVDDAGRLKGQVTLRDIEEATVE